MTAIALHEIWITSAEAERLGYAVATTWQGELGLSEEDARTLIANRNASTRAHEAAWAEQREATARYEADAAEVRARFGRTLRGMTYEDSDEQDPGFTIGEQDFLNEDEGIIGAVRVEPSGDVIVVYASVRTGTPPAQRARFAVWAREKFDRFREHGPEPDGWQLLDDGAYQLWAREVLLPPL